MRNTTTKIKRDMKKYIVLSLALFVTDLFSDNSQELQSHFKNSDVNFRDSDGDGMTDYAELKYGYDPLDGSSNSLNDLDINSYIVSDNLKEYNFDNHTKTKLIFSFSDTGFTNETKLRSKNYLKKVLPILLNELGDPYKNTLCRIRGSQSSSYSVSAAGNSIKFGKQFRPSSIVHEILHCWRASVNLHTVGNMAWEEGITTGITSFITNEYLKCYPHDENSKSMLSKRGSLGVSPYLFCSVDSLFDASKFQRNLVGWKKAEDTWEYYQHSGTFFKLFRSVNESFTKDFHSEFFKRIRNGESRSNEMVVDIISKLVPTINGVKTKDFIEKIHLFKKTSKLEDGFYSVMNRRGYVNYTPVIYPAFAKNNKFDWYSFDKSFEQIPTYMKPNGQIVPDLRNQPFQIDVNNANGVREFVYEGVSANKSNHDGSPSGNQSVKFGQLKPSNFDQGLYSVDVTFTNFIQTSKTANSSYYLFGKKNLIDEIKNGFTIMIGIDSDQLVNQYIQECEILIDGKSYTSPIIKNCAYFNLQNVPFDYTGEINIRIEGPNVPINFSGNKKDFIARKYVRTLTNGGSTDGHRHYCFVLIDEDFDGVEDAYDMNIQNLQIEWGKLVALAYSSTDENNDSVTETIVGEIGLDVTGDSNINTSIIQNQNTEIVLNDSNTESPIFNNEINTNVVELENIPLAPPSLVNVWNTCEQVESNWFHLDWFGYFYKELNNSWIYHEELGWMYVDFTTTFDSIWIYHEELGWRWTSHEIFPYLYNPINNTWVYIVNAGYYDFNTKSWIITE